MTPRGLTLADALAGVQPEPQTRADWDAMWLASLEEQHVARRHAAALHFEMQRQARKLLADKITRLNLEDLRHA